MSSDDSPFARIPEPGVGPRPSPVTYEQQIASTGAFAAGLRGRPPAVRFVIRAVGVLFVLLFLVAIVLTLFG